MPKIVHFGKYYFPDSGGIESVTVSMARSAAEAGHQVTVVCFSKDPAREEEFIDGVRVLRTRMDALVASQPLAAKYAYRCVREARDADIVHLHAPNMLGALCALPIPRRVKLIIHWHADIVNKGMLGRLTRPLESAVLRRADRILVTSKVYADASAALVRFLDKVTVVPPGVHDSIGIGSSGNGSDEVPEVLRSRLRDRKVILSVGRLVPYKGFEVLIEAAQYLRDDSVVLIVGEGAMRDSLQSLVDRMGVADRVYLSGRVSDKGLQSLFSKATLYCMSSINRAEAFGVVLLEAMAHALPIVATKIPGSGVSWVNAHGVSGLNVSVGDARELAEACNQILGSDSLRQKLSVGARQRFQEQFTETAAAERLLAVYERVLCA